MEGSASAPSGAVLFMMSNRLIMTMDNEGNKCEATPFGWPLGRCIAGWCLVLSCHGEPFEHGLHGQS